MQTIADTALLFFAFWVLTTFAILVLWLIFDGLDCFLHYLAQNTGTKLRTALLVLAFSAMLAAAITATYLHDAYHT